MKPTFLFALVVTLMFFHAPAMTHAQVVTRSVEYRDGDTVLEGYLAFDPARDQVDGKAVQRPAVIVVHEWWGLNDYAKHRARMLAELGYVAFAADIYGKGIVATTPAEAGKLATGYKSDRAALRGRINAALATVKKMANVDPKRVACIGYCFGGTTALELARSGADVAGVVSFHGGLGSPTPEDAKNIKGRALVLHGDADPFVPQPEIGGFLDEMRSAKVDFQFISFGGVVHSFTNPEADALNMDGAKYNAQADQRSWEYMKSFFNEIFSAPKP